MHERTPKWTNEALLFSALGAVACSGLLGIDSPSPKPGDDAPGGSGQAGEGSGEQAGMAGQSLGGSGGSTGSGGKTGGSGGRETGGTGGRNQGGSSGTATGGEGGGIEPPDTFPRAGDRCTAAGATACPGPAARETLICDGQEWIVNERCSDLYRCDRRTGTCSELICQTQGEPYCADSFSLVRCGPDLVTTTSAACAIECDVDQNVCVEPTGDQLIIHHPPDISTNGPIWQNPIIPVCIHDRALHSAEWDAIRDEVNDTWGRYAAVAFTGWDECAAMPSGVELRFDDACDHELAGISRFGDPGPGASVDVRICRTYVDARGQDRSAAVPLLRYVARHEFGHVLGRFDEPYEATSATFMVPWLRTSTFSSFGFDERNIGWLQTNYGRKPSNSLVNAAGTCVAEASGEPTASSCDGDASNAWQLEAGRVQHVVSMACLRAGASPGSVESGDCAFGSSSEPAVVWETRAVQWRGVGGRCVTVRSAPRTEMPLAGLAFEVCEAGREDQTFSFEFLSGGHVRILQSSTGLCVIAPEYEPGRSEWAFPDVSSTCGTGRDHFEARFGQLSFERRCIASEYQGGDLTTLEFKSCGPYPAYTWYLSGAFQNAAGDALTWSSSAPFLTSTPVGGAPTGSQIFDYHF